MASHAPSLNLLIHIGTVIRMESVPTKTGTPMVRISYSVTDKWKDRTTGEMRELSEYFNIALFGEQAKYAENNAVVGSVVFVKGSLRTKLYKDKSGVEKKSREPNVMEFSVFGSKPSDRPASQSAPSIDQPIPVGDFNDDIPF